MARSRLLVLATGGTIAGQAAHALAPGYVAGQVSITQLLEGIGPAGQALLASVDLQVEQIANIGSQDMEPRIWLLLADRIRAAFAEGRADAVVITHGTDTLEETAFLLDLILPPGPPVVLVSAMRPANALGADGPRNLVAGIRTALAPQSAGRGVLAVLDDTIFAAAAVYKSATEGVSAFGAAGVGGILGGVMGRGLPGSGAVHYAHPPSPAPWRGAHDFPAAGALARVPVLYTHVETEPLLIEALTDSGAAGIVFAGLGHGNLPRALWPALARARAAGLVLVRASRIDGGRCGRNLEFDDDGMGTLSAGALSPQKARILLQLLLAAGLREPAALQAEFDRF